jgi:hypothetical protein
VPRVDRFGEPIDDDEPPQRTNPPPLTVVEKRRSAAEDWLPFGRRACDLCSKLLDRHNASPWCRECEMIVSHRLGVAVEEWRDYGNGLLVSERGRVARLLRVDTAHRYPRVSIGGEKKYIHALVAETFVGPRPEGQLVLHWDDEPTNPDRSNLRYGSHADNAADARRNAERRAAVAAKLRQLDKTTPAQGRVEEGNQ